MKEPSKNLRKVVCKNKEHVLEELDKFINKGCDNGGKHDFHKIELVCGCSKCNSTFTVDKQVMEEVDIDKIINDDTNFKEIYHNGCLVVGYGGYREWGNSQSIRVCTIPKSIKPNGIRERDGEKT